MSFPAITVEVAFATNPGAAPTWTDVSTYTERSLDIQRGRSFELEQFNAGTAKLSLDNKDRRFDPSYTSGAYYPNIKPMKEIRIRAQLNLLSENQSSLETDTTGWVADTNVTIARSTAQSLDGSASLRMTATAASNMIASTSAGTSGIPVIPGESYAAVAQFRAATTGRTCKVQIRWYNSAGATISTSTADQTQADTNAGWTAAAYSAPEVAPSNAAYAAVLVTVLSPGAGEQHYVDKIGLNPDGDDTGWALGGYYDLFYGFVDGWPQKWQSPASALIEVGATDAFKVLATQEVKNTPYQLAVIDSAPETYYPFDETSGTVAYEYGSDYQSGTYPFGHPGEYSPGATGHSVTSIVGPGGGGNAIDFNGANDYVSLDSAAAVSGSVVAVECWIKTSQVPTVVMYMYYGYDDTPTFFLVEITPAGLVKLTRGSTTVLSTIAVNDGVAHHVMGYCSTSETTLWIDGVNRSASVPGSFPAVATTSQPLVAYGVYGEWFKGIIDEMATYASVLAKTNLATRLAAAATPWSGDTSGGRIERILDAIGWSALLRDVDTGISVLGSADVSGKSALTLFQNIAQTEDGLFFIEGDGKVTFRSRHWKYTNARATTSQATFGDGASDLLYEDDLEFEYDDQTIINDAKVTRTGGVRQVSINQTSIDEYLRHTKSLSGLDNLLDEESADHASWLTDHYAEPLVRIRQVTLRPSAHNTAAMWEACLGTKIGDRVTITKQTPAGGTITQAAHVEGVHHKINGVDWETTLSLSPAEVTNTYWILGTSALDTGTRLAF